MDNFLKPSSVKLGWCNSQRDVGKALKKKKKVWCLMLSGC